MKTQLNIIDWTRKTESIAVIDKKSKFLGKFTEKKVTWPARW